VLEAAVSDGWADPVPLLRSDLAEHERVGEHQLARTCRDLLRRAGAPTRRGRGGTPVSPALRAAGVTGREMDVLTMVNAGLTNAQIAARLYLSPRTVETHVARLLTKLAVRDRTELRARVEALASPR
jgi:DNA-binding NarL/FixJ family response regulator